MLKIGVIRGGMSNEYDTSLSSGGNILAHLRSEKLNNKYKTFDVLVDKAGVWHLNGIPTNFKKLAYFCCVIVAIEFFFTHYTLFL
mgnify:CR=1 FL=1